MANNLTLSVTLTGDGRQLTGTLRNAQGEVREFGGTTERESARAERALEGTGQQAQTVSGHLNQLRTVAIGVGAALTAMGVSSFANDTYQAVSSSQQLQASLKTVTGSIANASAAWNTLLGFAAETPFTLDQSVQAFIRMQSLGLKPSQEALRSYGNTAAAMGKDMMQMVEAVADATTGEFERLKEFGIRASKEGEQVSFTFQGVTTTVANSASAISQYLQEIGELQFAGAMADQMDTLSGKASNLEDTIYQFYLAIGDAGATGVFEATLANASSTVQFLTDNIDTLASGAEILAVLVGGRVAVALTTATTAMVAKTLATQADLRAEAAAAVANTRRTAAEKQTALALLSTARLEAQATQGTAAHTFALQQLSVARTRAATAAGAHTAAMNTATAATARASVAARGLSGALALVGGPLGLLVGGAGLLYLFRDELGLTVPQVDANTTAVNKLTNGLDDMSQAAAQLTLTSLVGQLAEVRAQAEVTAEAFTKVGQIEGDGGGGFLGVDVTAQTNAVRELGETSNATQQEAANLEAAIALVESRIGQLGERNREVTPTVTEIGDASETAAAKAKEMAKAASEQADAIEALRNRMIPHRQETVQLAQDQNTLNLAFAMGRVSAADYLSLMGALQQSYMEVTDTSKKAADQISVDVSTWTTISENGIRRVDDAGVDLWLGLIDGSRNAMDTVKRGIQQSLAEIAHMLTTQRLTVAIAGSLGFNTSGAGGMGGVGSGGGFGISPGSINNAWQALQGGIGGIQWGGVGSASAYGGTGFANAATSGLGQTGFMGGSLNNFSGMQGLAGLGAGFAGNWLGGQLFGQGKHSSTLGTIGGAVGTYFGGPLGALAGSTLGSALGGIFGGSWETKDAGLNLGVSSGDITGNQYENQRKSGGWFSSSKSRTRTSALNGELEAMLQDAYAAQEASLAVTLETLGQQSSALNAFSSGLTRISTKGLDEAEVEQAVQEWLQNVVNSAAASVTDPSQYARAGETTVDTLSRLAAALSGINPILEQLHENSLAASLAGGDAASHLAELAGGIDAFSARADYYYQNVLTEAERQERAMNAAAQAMGAFTARTGRVIESTDALRELVDGIDLTTASGRELYNQAMNLAPALVEIERGLERVGQQFEQMLADASAVVSDAEAQVRQAWQTFDRQSFSQQIELLNLIGDAEGALALERERELATIDEALRPTQERIWAIQDEIAVQQNATQAARNYQNEVARVRDQLNQQLGNIGNWLDQQRATSGTPEMNLATAQEQLARQLVLIENGDRTALQNITQYAQQVLEANQAFNASSAAGQRIQEDVYAAIRALPDAISAEEYLATEIRDALQSVVISAMPTDERLTFELSRELIRLDANQLTVSQVRTALEPIATDAEISKLIREVDTNGDGIITRQELGNARLSGLAGGIGTTLKPMFDAIDLDASGLIDWNEFYGAFEGLASDQELRRIFQKLDADGSGTISRLEALNRSNEGTEANTDSLEKQARDQLRELNGLVSEMARSTDQFVGLNTTMVSLRESISALGVAQEEVARIEQERLAAEKAERERIERERVEAQRGSLASEIDRLQREQQSLANTGVSAPSRSVINSSYRHVPDAVNNINRIADSILGSSGVTDRSAERLRDYYTTGGGFAQDQGVGDAPGPGGAYSPGGLYWPYVQAYINEIESAVDTRQSATSLDSEIARLRAELNKLNSVDGSHATGLWNVPFDGYIAELHRDEMVVPAQTAGRLRELPSRELPMPALPNFPLLGNNDVLETLRDLKREIAELRRDNARLQGESNKHLAAANNQRGAAATQQIAATERGNRMLKKMEDDKRLEAAKR